MSTRDSGDWAAMRVTSWSEEARQAAPAAAVRKKRLRLADGFGVSIIYLAFICSTVGEYGGEGGAGGGAGTLPPGGCRGEFWGGGGGGVVRGLMRARSG